MLTYKLSSFVRFSGRRPVSFNEYPRGQSSQIQVIFVQSSIDSSSLPTTKLISLLGTRSSPDSRACEGSFLPCACSPCSTSQQYSRVQVCTPGHPCTPDPGTAAQSCVNRCVHPGQCCQPPGWGPSLFTNKCQALQCYCAQNVPSGYALTSKRFPNSKSFRAV